MGLWTTLLGGFWSGLLAGSLGILLTAPFRYIVPAFLCGFAGRAARDLFISWGVGLGWSTMGAAAVVVLAAAALTRRHIISPVILISGVLPLAASAAVFNAILDLMKVSALEGDALHDASISLISNSGKAFTVSLSVALGLATGVMIVRLIRRKRAWEGV